MNLETIDTNIFFSATEEVAEDFIDCLILLLAINKCDILITEDKDIKCLEEKEEYQKS